MTLPATIVRVYFGVEYGGGTFAIYDDPVKGVYDDPTYLYATADGAGVEVQTDTTYATIRRGRSRERDEFEAGQAQIVLQNYGRQYDPFNTGGAYYGDVTPGKRIEIERFGQLIFAGTIEDWDLEWETSGETRATILALDALGVLARKEFDAWTTTAGQGAGARLSDVLDRPEVSFGPNRSLDAGVATLQADNVTWGSNVLNYCQLVAKSEYGRFYADRANLLTFDDRTAFAGATTVLTFADDGTGIRFHGVTTTVGAELLYNRVGVDREGGTLQTSEDATSQEAYGVRSLSMTGLLMDSDGQAEQMADYLLGIYKDPTKRVATVTVDLSDPNLTGVQAAAVAMLDMGDIVRAKWTPLRLGSAIDDRYVVEGVEHQITPAQHVVTVNLSPLFQQVVAIYDDPVWGVYDDANAIYSF